MQEFEVFCRLGPDISVDFLRSLASVVEPSRRFHDLKMVLNYVLEFQQAQGSYPTQSMIEKVAGGLPEVSGKESKEFCEELLAEVKDFVLRERLMDLSGKDVVSVSDIGGLLKCVGSGCALEDVCSVADYDGQEAYNRVKERPVGMKLFIDALDEEVSGLGYGTLTTIFGFVASLKTTMGLSLAYTNAKHLGYSGIILTLEVPKREVYFNLLSRHAFEMYPNTKITAKRIKKALLEPEEEALLWEEIEPVSNLPD